MKTSQNAPPILPVMRNFAQAIRRHASLDPDRVAVRFEESDPLSYRQFDFWIDAVAHQLHQKFQIRRGDRVAWLGYNNPALLAALYACARIGAILVPVNWRLSSAEISYVIQDCQPSLLIFGADFAQVAGEAAGGICKTLPLGDLTHERGQTVPFEGEGQLGDTLLIVYTSGTTGRPKGAMLSQEALYVNALNSLDMHEMRRSDTILVCLPLFHVGGLNIQLTPGLFVGAEIILLEKFDPIIVSEFMTSHKPDLMVLVPVMMKAISTLPNWADADYSSLRQVTTGSSTIPLELIAIFEEKGLSVIQIYGSTETGPIAVYQRPGEGKSNPRSTGKSGLLSEARIVDNEGSEIVTFEIDGEIEIRGRHIMQGYWNNLEATRAAFSGDWFRTGDIGCFDSDNYLYFRDRRNNLIVSGGENIYPAEIERVLLKIPGLVEAAIVGIPDVEWGHVPVGLVVVSDKSLDQASILQRLAGELARYKLPRRLHVVAELPRNAMGKVVAEKVREKIQQL